jgi:hypothetical protein
VSDHGEIKRTLREFPAREREIRRDAAKLDQRGRL